MECGVRPLCPFNPARNWLGGLHYELLVEGRGSAAIRTVAPELDVVEIDPIVDRQPPAGLDIVRSLSPGSIAAVTQEARLLCP